MARKMAGPIVQDFQLPDDIPGAVRNEAGRKRAAVQLKDGIGQIAENACSTVDRTVLVRL